MNKNQVYKQLEYSHQLLQIWEKYKYSHRLDHFAMVDDVDAPETEFGARSVDLEGGASGFDVCEQSKQSTIDHAQMYVLDL
jgi:hypothetical protein